MKNKFVEPEIQCVKITTSVMSGIDTGIGGPDASATTGELIPDNID